MEMKRIDSEDQGGASSRMLKKPATMCESPTHLIGVQAETPLAWSMDGSTLLFASENHSIYLCEYNESKDGEINVPIVDILPTQHRFKVLDATFHPKYPETNEVVSCGMDGILVWNASEVGVKHRQPVSDNVGETKLHTAQVECLCWAYGGDVLITGSKDNTIRLWDATNNYQHLEVLTSHKAAVLTLAYCEETKMLASSGRDSMLIFWNLESISPDLRAERTRDQSIKCNILSSLDGHRGDVCTLTWSDGGRSLLSGARDNSIKLWDCEMFKELREITSANPHDADIRRLTYVKSNDGEFILSFCFCLFVFVFFFCFFCLFFFFFKVLIYLKN